MDCPKTVKIINLDFTVCLTLLAHQLFFKKVHLIQLQLMGVYSNSHRLLGCAILQAKVVDPARMKHLR